MLTFLLLSCVEPPFVSDSETSPADTAGGDTDLEDTDLEDTDLEDTDLEDTDLEDTDLEDTDPEDTDPEDTDPEDTDPEDTDPEDTDLEDTDPEDTADDSATDTDTDSEPDADGDGYDRVGVGGDDCDDTDPSIHPGAIEACDAVDHDCDGDPLAAGLCSDVISWATTGTHLLENAPMTHIAGVRDITGDGVGDLEMIRRDRDETGRGSNTLLVYAGGSMPDTPWRGDLSEAHYRMTAAPWLIGLEDVGDVDGDGQNDLGVVGHAYWGSIRHVLGPLPSDATSDWDGLEVVVEFGHLALWSPHWTGIDVDGDGAADIAGSNPGVGDGFAVPSELYHQVYFGGEWTEPCDVRSRNGGAVSEWGPTGVLGDGDGDGLPEVAFQTNGLWIVRGADLRDLCSGYIEDYAAGWRDDTFEGYYFGDPLGDWTGDGYGEFPTWAPGGQDTGEPGIWILSAADVLSGAYGEADALGSWVSPIDDTSVAGAVAGDFDGDGTDDLFLTGFDENAVIRGGAVPAPFDPLPARRLRYDSGWWCGYFGSCADVTGDGFVDLVFWESDRRAETMNAWLVPGFDVPWDDPTWW